MDAILEIAAERDLRLEDIGMNASAAPEIVRAKCDEVAAALVEGFMSRTIDWPKADAIANHIFDLMIQHCGGKVPDYAWDVYLAFDESEIGDRGDPHARLRISEVISKYVAT